MDEDTRVTAITAAVFFLFYAVCFSVALGFVYLAVRIAKYAWSI